MLQKRKEKDTQQLFLLVCKLITVAVHMKHVKKKKLHKISSFLRDYGMPIPNGGLCVTTPL